MAIQAPGHEKEPDISTGRPSIKAQLAMAVVAINMAACDSIKHLFGDEGSKNPAAAAQALNSSVALPADPNRPEFLDQKLVTMTGLTLMMANNDAFDRFAFNAVTGNKSFAHTFDIRKGYEFEFQDGRKFTMPYHAFLFKPFDTRSNVQLPERLGKASPDASLANLFKQYTVYKGNNPKDIAAIKTILITSYELSFGLKLDPNNIVIESDENGRIKGIKYTGALQATTTIATKTEPDPNNPESRNPTETAEKNWNLVGNNGELVFPPTAMVDQGIALPYSALLKYPNVAYAKKFKSQGKTVTVNMNIPIDDVVSEQEQLAKQGRPENFSISEGVISKNLGYFIVDNSPLVAELAQEITRDFPTVRGKMQAILDFAHVHNYVPDAFGEAPRTPRITLISKGGDCEDSSILVVALAKAVGIDCIFAYFDGHAAPLCDIGESGSALIWGDKKYEWCETTGGNQGMVTVTDFVDANGKIVKTDRKARAWRIGEQPKILGPIQFVSRVEDQQLTRIGQ